MRPVSRLLQVLIRKGNYVDADKRIERVLVLGGGSAGFLAAITLKMRLPHLSVQMIRSPDIGIIGVGEATTTGLPGHLHRYLKLEIGELFRLAEPTWKLGIRFLWGKRPYFDYGFGRQIDIKYTLLTKPAGFYCDDGPTDYIGINSALMTKNKVWVRQRTGSPLVNNDYAYHIENKKFVSYLEQVARRQGVAVQEDTVVEVQQDDAGITGLRLASGTVAMADLFIDSSGFRSLLLDQTLEEPYISFSPSLYCDRAVVGDWQRTDEPVKPYTTAETMNCGWCWQIDHEKHINRGYVHSSAFISEADAEAEFRSKNPKIGPTRIVRFKSGRYVRGWVKNVVAIGNSSGFVEPLESTGLGVAIAAQSQTIVETLRSSDGILRPSLVHHYNRRHARDWDNVRRFLVVHYKYNTRLDTPFWRACRADAVLGDAAPIVEYYQENGPCTLHRTSLLGDEDPFGMEGWLSLLLGQQVPYRKTFTPSDAELATWQSIRETMYINAKNGIDTTEALQMTRSPGFTWPEHLYQN